MKAQDQQGSKAEQKKSSDSESNSPCSFSKHKPYENTSSTPLKCLCIYCVSLVGFKSPVVKQKDSAMLVRDGATAMEELQDRSMYSYQQISCLDSVIRFVVFIL